MKCIYVPVISVPVCLIEAEEHLKLYLQNSDGKMKLEEWEGSTCCSPQMLGLLAILLCPHRKKKRVIMHSVK